MPTASQHRASPADVAARLAPSIGALARDLTGAEPSSRTRAELRFRTRGSLAVAIGGPARGSWFDHEAGQGGDALGLVAHLRGCTMGEAYRWALAWLGGPAPRRPEPPPDPPRRPPEAEPATAELAARLWRETGPAAGSPVERYLAGRGLALPPAELFADDPADHRNTHPLRFHPRAWRNRAFGPPGPAMVALMTDPTTGETCGAHLTYLRADGAGKAEGERKKIMLGAAGVVRLVPDAEVTQGLGIAEGIETALGVMRRGWAPVWATGSAGGIARFPVLPGIGCLTLFPDADDGGAGLDAARRCAERWHAAGAEVRIGTPPAGTDFADMAGRAA